MLKIPYLPLLLQVEPCHEACRAHDHHEAGDGHAHGQLVGPVVVVVGVVGAPVEIKVRVLSCAKRKKLKRLREQSFLFQWE